MGVATKPTNPPPSPWSRWPVRAMGRLRGIKMACLGHEKEDTSSCILTVKGNSTRQTWNGCQLTQWGMVGVNPLGTALGQGDGGETVPHRWCRRPVNRRQWGWELEGIRVYLENF